MIGIYLLIGLTLLTFWLIWTTLKRPKDFPPGPHGIPVFGNALQLGIEHYKKAIDLSKTYGDIIGCRMGSNWIVYFNNPDDIREVFNKGELTGPCSGYNGFLDEETANANYGLLLSYGQKWFHNRRFTLRTLRDFGFGKKTSEGIIMEEVQDLVGRLKKISGKPLSTHNYFNSAVFNVIWSIVAGERFEQEDANLRDLIAIFTDCFDSTFTGLRPLLFIFPWLIYVRKALPFLFSSKSDEFRAKLFAFLRKTIKQHEETIQPGQPRDYIDAMLEESKNIEGFEEMDMICTLMDLFMAGSETTSTTLCWTFFLFAQHPQVQDKLYKEIENVVGNREVALSDRPSLPYMEATMLEILRVSSIAPFGSPHGITEDIMYKGYRLPKNAVVIQNIYACHRSQELWGDPEKFRPERFLSPDEKTIVRNKGFMPFGIGKRACLGESLARDEIFLFVSNLVQNFNIRMPQDEPCHSLEGKMTGGVLTPEPHKVIVLNRN